MDEGPVTLAESAPLGEDLPCLRCHYNLRTLAPSANCPECATPIAKSIDHWQKFGGMDLLRLQRGAVFFAAYVMIPGLWGLWLAPYLYKKLGMRLFQMPWQSLLLATDLVMSALLIAGIIQFRKIFVPVRPRLAALVSLLCLLFALMSPCADLAPFVLNHAFQNPSAKMLMDWALTSWDAAGELGAAAQWIVACLLVRRVAQRIERPWLATATALAMLPNAALCLYYALRTGVLVLARASTEYRWLDAWAPRIDKWVTLLWKYEPSQNLREGWLLLTTAGWIVILLTTRRARLGHHPVAAVGLLIDPAPRAVAPLSLEAFFSRPLLTAAALLTLVPAAGCVGVIFHSLLPAAEIAGLSVAPLLAVALAILAAATTVVAATCRRNLQWRHRLRAGGASLLAAVALLLQGATLLPDAQRSPWDWQPNETLLISQLFLLSALLLSARAFMINTARTAGLLPLALLIRIVAGIGVGVALFAAIAVRLWLTNRFNELEHSFRLAPVFLAVAFLLLSGCGALFWLGIRRLGARP